MHVTGMTSLRADYKLLHLTGNEVRKSNFKLHAKQSVKNTSSPKRNKISKECKRINDKEGLLLLRVL